MKNKTYGTVDLYLAAFLKAKKIRFVGIEKSGRQVTFLFEDDGQIQKIVTDFYNDGTVKVNDYKNALQDLKSIVFNTAY